MLSGREGGEGLGEFKQDGHAGGIVECAAENLVSGQIWIAAKVIPVRGVDYIFIS